MPVARKAATPAAKATPAKKAAPAKATATKATPARTSKVAAKVEAEEPDLLAAMNEPESTVEDDEDFDLLSDLTEDNGLSWIPWDDEDQPEGIQGRVVGVGEVDREQRYGGGTAVLIQIEAKDGQVWSIRGYATVLANQLEREIEKGLSVGDFLAVKYLGEKENKSGDNSYKNFATASKRR